MTDNAVRPASVAAKEDYAEGRGSVADLQTIPQLAGLRNRLAALVKRDLPVVENNFYYEIGTKCGIGWVSALAGSREAVFGTMLTAPGFTLSSTATRSAASRC